MTTQTWDRYAPDAFLKNVGMNRWHKESLICAVSLTSGEHRIDDFIQREVYTLEPVEGQRNNLVSTTTTLYSKVQTAISDY
jgi:hypothetical protein